MRGTPVPQLVMLSSLSTENPIPVGLPPGTNRMYLSIYSPWDFTAAEVNGETRGMSAQTELGWNVYSTTIDIPPGGETEIRLDLSGTVPDVDEYGFTLRSQAMVFPDVVRLDVRDATGDAWISSHEIRTGVERFWRDDDSSD